MAFEIDASKLPVVVVTFPPTVSAEAYQELFAQYGELSRKHPRMAWLIDFQSFNPVSAPAPVRRAAADCFSHYRAQLIPVSICEARVVQSLGARGVLTAFDWLTGAKWPTRNFESRLEAERWIDLQIVRDPKRRD